VKYAEKNLKERSIMQTVFAPENVMMNFTRLKIVFANVLGAGQNLKRLSLKENIVHGLVLQKICMRSKKVNIILIGRANLLIEKRDGVQITSIGEIMCLKEMNINVVTAVQLQN
jgi:hypothetical protein